MRSDHNLNPPEIDLPKLSQPALRALAGIGCTRLEQVAALTENQLKRLHGIGPNAYEQLRRAMVARGPSFATEENPKGV